MPDDLRERYAVAATEWALMYPISSWALREGEAAEGLAKVWGEQIARYLTKHVRDEEVERLRAKLASLQAFADRCREKDWAHSAEQAKRREQAEAERDALKAAVERVERLRDKWLTWPKDDMHYAAGLMLDKHLSGEAFTVDTRCPSCDHLAEHHQPEGCWYGITTSAPGRDLVCPCIVPYAPHSPAEPVSPVSTPTEAHGGTGEAQEG